MRLPIHTLFWVCLFETEGQRHIIALTTNMAAALRQQPSEDKLLYFRMFNDMQEAIGHKLLMEHLSRESIEVNIRSVNPRMIDMRQIAEQLYNYD